MLSPFVTTGKFLLPMATSHIIVRSLISNCSCPQTVSCEIESPYFSPNTSAAKDSNVDPRRSPKGNGPVIHVRDLPRRSVGEIVVIGVTPTTATGMVVFSMEDMHAGDDVEVDEVQ